jgi:hypothetical protein
MINWYRRKAIESCSRTQCNPMLFVVAFVVALGVLTYVYREVIIETLKIMAIVAVCGVALLLLGVLVVTGIRYHRRHADFGLATAAITPSHMPEVNGDADKLVSQSPLEATMGNPNPEGMADEADWLADEHVTLAWDPNGVLKGGRTQ